MKSKSVLSAIILSFIVMSTHAQASLLTIGTVDYSGGSYNLIYDNDGPFGSIVWFDYTDGMDSWHGKSVWASSLDSALQSVNYHLNRGIKVNWNGGWRLPSTVDQVAVYGYDGTTTSGYNITTSEFGHLFYVELGDKGYRDVNGISHWLDYGLTNVGDFNSMRYKIYWSNINQANYQDYAWAFASDGFQGLFQQGANFSAIAVRSAQVEIAVPEPSTALLFGAGFGVLAFWRRKARP